MAKIVKIITVDGEEIELEVQKDPLRTRISNTVCNTFWKVVHTATDHPIATIVVMAAGAEAISKVMNGYAGIKRVNVQQQELNKGKLEYYDRKRDLYYRLRRPMTNQENLEFSSRRREGEDAGMILSDMNLI